MHKHHLRFRQVHLDFHTSPAIPGIGTAFDKKRWQETLKKGHVDSITCFSKCHHGWSYHPTAVGKVHPHLSFDLLRAQFEACKEISVNVPVYLSAGVDNVASFEHPEWREVGFDGRYCGWAQDITAAGFHTMCFNTPYLEYLCAQIREAARLFPACDGIFLDIISQSQCCCKWCLEVMEKNGWDASLEADRKKCAESAMERYYSETTAAAKCDNPDMPVFHNSGHVSRGKTGVLKKYFSHLELESLPTGGWGYDHYPISAKYAQNTGLDFLGMTGKFHTTWGEFGGYKHPNALRYECAAMLAYGSKCSVGDQLHPCGALDESTYGLIGAAYAGVERKEPWCGDVTSIADVALLSSTAVNASEHRDLDSDTGAGRVLLEAHFLFDVIDQDMDFSPYKMLVLPDEVKVGPALKTKLDTYLAKGGKLFLTGSSGVSADGCGFLWDMGATCCGISPVCLDYILPCATLQADFVHSPMVMYAASYRVRVADGESLGQVYDSYFNRTFKHFCSHQHTPYRMEPSGFDCGVRKGNILYLAHPVFTLYKGTGAVALREYIAKALRCLLGDSETAQVALPSTGRITLMKQPAGKRYVLHLLHANTIQRGGAAELSGGNNSVGRTSGFEVIEDLLPIHNIAVSLRLPDVTRARLVPEGTVLPLTEEDGRIKFIVPTLLCHQMIELT